MLDETRIVKMVGGGYSFPLVIDRRVVKSIALSAPTVQVLSDVSMSISSPFSSDLISTVEFRFVKAPEEEVWGFQNMI